MSVSSTDSPPSNPLKLVSSAVQEPPRAQAAGEGILLLGPDGTIQFVDHAAADIFGYESAALLEHHILELLEFAIETDPEGLRIQWDLLLSSALETRVPVPAARGDGTRERCRGAPRRAGSRWR